MSLQQTDRQPGLLLKSSREVRGGARLEIARSGTCNIRADTVDFIGESSGFSHKHSDSILETLNANSYSADFLQTSLVLFILQRTFVHDGVLDL